MYVQKAPVGEHDAFRPSTRRPVETSRMFTASSHDHVACAHAS